MSVNGRIATTSAIIIEPVCQQLLRATLFPILCVVGRESTFDWDIGLLARATRTARSDEGSRRGGSAQGFVVKALTVQEGRIDVLLWPWHRHSLAQK